MAPGVSYVVYTPPAPGVNTPAPAGSLTGLVQNIINGPDYPELRYPSSQTWGGDVANALTHLSNYSQADVRQAYGIIYSALPGMGTTYRSDLLQQIKQATGPIAHPEYEW